MSGPTLGKYRLIAELGHGGMADVFLALVAGPLGSGFAKLAVVKKLRANLAEDPEFVSMLIDEARITARLNHPNVVQMLEVGFEGSEYFLAMEYLDGQPLHRIARRADKVGRPLSTDAQMLVVAEVLAGLHHAHELQDYDGSPLNVIHRDVTPHNVFITYNGQVKVVDFGIAKAAGRASETKHGVVKGKVRYMSPEQALGVSLDRRADVFAAGVMLWQAVTGAKFWGDRDELAVVQALVSGDYATSPRAVRADVSPELDAICRRALARRPEERYATAAEMRADLEAHLDVRSLAARRELTDLVTELFESERAKVRGVLEGVGKFAVSSAAFVAATQPPGASSSSVSCDATAVLDVPPAPPRARRLGIASLPPSAMPGESGTSAITLKPPPRPRGLMVAVPFVAVATFALAIAGFAATNRTARADAEPTRVSFAPLEVKLAGALRTKDVPSSVVYVYETVEPSPSRPATRPTPASAPSSTAATPRASASGDASANTNNANNANTSAVGASRPSSRSGKVRLSIDSADPWSLKGN